MALTPALHRADGVGRHEHHHDGTHNGRQDGLVLIYKGLYREKERRRPFIGYFGELAEALDKVEAHRQRPHVPDDIEGNLPGAVGVVIELTAHVVETPQAKGLQDHGLWQTYF